MSVEERPLVLVTGAGGFVGGHVARAIAQHGAYKVRGLVRRVPIAHAGDPDIAWMVGDLRDPASRTRALQHARFVIHCAGWVRLGQDPSRISVQVNVDATRALMEEARAVGVSRFVYTSTLQTLAAGGPTDPANEDAAWNLSWVRSHYTETKREAERMVLAANSPEMRTLAICPGMVVGPRDPGPTSTRVLLMMSKMRIAILPAGGIPIIEAEVLAKAHLQALTKGEAGTRYAVIGPYFSFRDLAGVVAKISGYPRRIVRLPDWTRHPLGTMANAVDWAAQGRFASVNRAVVAGGYLRFHVDGSRADRVFGLEHHAPEDAIARTLASARDAGQAPWLQGRILRGV